MGYIAATHKLRPDWERTSYALVRRDLRPDESRLEQRRACPDNTMVGDFHRLGVVCIGRLPTKYSLSNRHRTVAVVAFYGRLLPLADTLSGMTGDIRASGTEAPGTMPSAPNSSVPQMRLIPQTSK